MSNTGFGSIAITVRLDPLVLPPTEVLVDSEQLLIGSRRLHSLSGSVAVKCELNKFRFDSDLVQKYMLAPETEPDKSLPYMGDRKFNPLQFCHRPPKIKYQYHVEEWIRGMQAIRYRTNEAGVQVGRILCGRPSAYITDDFKYFAYLQNVVFQGMESIW